MRFNHLAAKSEKLLAPFFSPRITAAIFHSVLIVSGLFVLFWPWQGAVRYMEQHDSPLLFSAVFNATLIISSYLSLRCGRSEMGQNVRKSGPPGDLPDNLLSFFLYPVFFLVPVAPFGMLAAAVSGLSLLAFGEAFSMVFTASVLCWLFGFLMRLRGVRLNVLGYLGSRIFLLAFIFVTFGLAREINPLFIIYELNRNPQSFRFDLTNSYLVYMVIVIPAIGFFAIVSWLVKKKRRTYP